MECILILLDISQNDFLGFDSPNETLYTGISATAYCLCFVILYLCQTLAIFIMKWKFSTDFRSANLLDQVLHVAESTNFAFSMHDWDVKKTGGPNENYERMKAVRFEIILNILINLATNLILLTPLPCLCKYSKSKIS